MYIYINKQSGKVSAHGSLKSLVDNEEIKKAKQTFYNSIDFSIEDYEDEMVKICKREIVRSKQNIL